jgi:hypothetical protein
MTEPRHFSEALQSLARVDEANRQAADTASSTTPVPSPLTATSTVSVRALDSDPNEAQARREGTALLAAMRSARVTGEKWMSAGSLTERKP